MSDSTDSTFNAADTPHAPPSPTTPDASMTTIDVGSIVGSGFPENLGPRLAEHLLEISDWTDVTLDFRRCEPETLASSFFNGFLEHIERDRPERWAEVRCLNWQANFAHQDRYIERRLRQQNQPTAA